MTGLPLPSTREEAWRWSHLSALPTLADAPHKGGVPSALPWLGLGGAALLFVDGVIEKERSIFGPIRMDDVKASTDHPLARLANGEGWVLVLDEGVDAGSIEIIHVSTGGANHLPARIELGTRAQAQIVETYVGDGWTNRLTQIVLASAARLDRAVRILQNSGFASVRDEVHLGASATLTGSFLGAGAAGSRIDAAITIEGDDGHAHYGGALLSRGDQRQETAVVLRHAAENGTSRQSWRAVADDNAVTSLAARVEVARGAQKTDGEQSLRGLLLKRTATVNLKPELEIFADDVKCAHGATVGELDRHALFYMQSRGINAAHAQALLTRAFIADAFDGITDDTVRDAFVAGADDWLGRRI